MSAGNMALSQYRRKMPVDGLLLTVFLVVGLIEVGLIFYGNTLDPPEMTKEEVREFYARRFATIERIAPPPVEELEVEQPDALTTPSDLAEQEQTRQEVAQEALERPEERQQGTAQQRQERREAAQASRAQRRAAINQQVINSAGGLALVTGSSGSAVASDLVDAAQVTAGGAISTEGLSQMVTGQSAENVRRLRTDAPQGGGSGGVDLQSALSDVDASVAGGTVGDLLEGEVQTYDRAGKFSAEAARSPQALRTVIAGYTPGLKDCYESQLRRSSNLRGSTMVKFSIQADGSVTDIDFSRSTWSDERYGRNVERCMRRKIASWRFDPVDDSLGAFTMGQKFTFGN